MSHYNPWPLGQLPESWRRPEPYLIREAGYGWQDPRDIVGLFEEKLASYSGSKFAVLTDCCTNAIFLSLRYLVLSEQLDRGDEITIPDQTYVSVPQAVFHAGLAPRLKDISWKGTYRLGDTPVVDGAGRFTQGMYEFSGAFHCLSFQIKKRLPIGRGGAVLTDDGEAANWIRQASYDGRNLLTAYDSKEHVSGLGWHMYMTPEDAARGILLMDELPDVNEDTMTFESYPKISNYSGMPSEWRAK
jgi:dTDP-4-amino-4,6-dideoxygalactose transaminase